MVGIAGGNYPEWL